MTPESLGAGGLDALQELASIGSGQALTALARLLGRRVDMDVPEAWLGRDPGAVASFLGSMGQELVAVGVRLTGLLRGRLVLALPEKDAAGLAALLGQPCQGGAWGELSESALLESGNIVGSAFVSAIAAMVGEKLLLGVPTLTRGGGPACLDGLVGRDSGEAALATRFLIHGAPALEGLVLVMPEPGALPELLASLMAAAGRADPEPPGPRHG